MIHQMLYQPCGGVAEFDGDYSYRCHDCMAVIGSMGQPSACKEEAQKYDMLKALGGKGWDYVNGTPAVA